MRVDVVEFCRGWATEESGHRIHQEGYAESCATDIMGTVMVFLAKDRFGKGSA